jgi:uncharacterized heparinase superfamily protein
LLDHFRGRPYSLFGFADAGAVELYFPGETARLASTAAKIADQTTWELAGFGEIKFGAEYLWRSDPLTQQDWGLDYHADIVVYREGGPDIRVLWELNRLGHLVPLALAYAATADERFAETFFQHIESWMEQNPYGRGANWNCAMEAALRAINVLAAFDILRLSAACTEEKLLSILQFLDQHGRFILANNEFSYVGTSNHYLSDVIGLFWIGTMVPELEHAAEWREFGRREMLNETEKQVLPDGADFEASTGYHKFVTEMLLYSHLLAECNRVEMPAGFAKLVNRMLLYISGITRPDGKVPLIGDADGSQIVPMIRRDADDQAYLLALGTAVFKDSALKEFAVSSPEMFWLLGEEGIKDFTAVDRPRTPSRSRTFEDAGAYVMRDGDLYLHLNTGDIGANGRGSHGHNDALALEVSAYGRPFIIDPGSYVYNLDREQRHLFRSTGYHSTVLIDGIEQNTTNADLPFIMGNEAKPRVRSWETNADNDRIEAEHYGYNRLPEPVTHRRTVTFDKADRYWLIEDALTGGGTHQFRFVFHLAPGVSVEPLEPSSVRLIADGGVSMMIGQTSFGADPQIRPSFFSRSYGHREECSILEWATTAAAPFNPRFFVVPAGPRENIDDRLELLHRLTDNIT